MSRQLPPSDDREVPLGYQSKVCVRVKAAGPLPIHCGRVFPGQVPHDSATLARFAQGVIGL